MRKKAALDKRGQPFLGAPCGADKQKFTICAIILQFVPNYRNMIL
jgi:hypothetical protein